MKKSKTFSLQDMPREKLCKETGLVYYEVLRSYKMLINGTYSKTEIARYTYNRFNIYYQRGLGHYFFKKKDPSTAGMGQLANQAFYKAKGNINALKAAEKATGNKINVPFQAIPRMPALIEKSKTRKFDYWIKVSNQWTKASTVRLPANSHKKINEALRNGFELSKNCELKIINGNMYALVFLKKRIYKELPKARQLSGHEQFVGVDVGVANSATVVSSKGKVFFSGDSLSKAIKKSKKHLRNKNRNRGKIRNKIRQDLHKERGFCKISARISEKEFAEIPNYTSKEKTYIKQRLNKNAKQIINRVCERRAEFLIVEDPSVISNISRRSLTHWAGAYLAHRLAILGLEKGVRVLAVHPAYTSITCPNCGYKDRTNRETQAKFSCVKCSHERHADENAARNIARKGALIARKSTKTSKAKSGGVKTSLKNQNKFKADTTSA